MSAKYLAIDTETGGLSKDYPSLLSLYMAVLDENLETVADLDLLIKPDDGVYVVTGEALRINRINLATHDEKAITYKEAKSTIRKFLNSVNPNGEVKLIPVGQNVAFDIQFMQQDWALGIKAETWNKYVSYRVLDTGTVAQFFQQQGKIPTSVSGSLGKLIKHFNIDIPEESRHTAKGDVIATVEVLKKLLEL